MKKQYKITALVVSLVLMAFVLTSCTLTKSASSNETTTESSSGESVSGADIDTLINENDVSVTTEGATAIVLNGNSVQINGSGATADGTTVTVTSGGTYEINGTLSDGRIIVNADGEEVTLILNNANITCSYSSAIYIYEAKSATVYLADGSQNTLFDGSSYSYNDSYSSEADEEPNACLYSKDDLIIAGSGKLSVNGNLNNGITSKDTLLIENVTLTVKAVNTGIKGKDDLAIKSGVYNLDCDGDTIHGDNSTTILDGTFSLTSGDDAIHAENTLTIQGGTFTITAHEGLEATIIVINGGKLEINASDDGINAAQKIDGVTPTVKINGGEITINMGQGDTDGIDANGNIEINGGTVNINAQSPFDYDGTGAINGGTVYVNGSQVTSLSNQFGGMGGQMPGGMQGGQPPQGGGGPRG